MAIPRLRLFAGPNGSGKSTMKSVLRPELIGYYINPDDIEKSIRDSNYFDLNDFGISVTANELISFFSNSSLLQKVKLVESSKFILLEQNKIDFSAIEINSYYASVVSDLIRQKLIESEQSFCTETVMSSSDKIDLLSKSKQSGYRNYLYYIATADPMINISRIKHRVKSGGHNVPEEKIISRYFRSLDLMLDAIKQTDRAYIFDNSGDQLLWLAEITSGTTIELKSNHIPVWLKTYLLDKIN